jgi:hypothetical protein
MCEVALRPGSGRHFLGRVRQRGWAARPALPRRTSAGERAADATATAVVAVFGDQPAGELGHLRELRGETRPVAPVL